MIARGDRGLPSWAGMMESSSIIMMMMFPVKEVGASHCRQGQSGLKLPSVRGMLVLGSVEMLHPGRLA